MVNLLARLLRHCTTLALMTALGRQLPFVDDSLRPDPQNLACGQPYQNEGGSLPTRAV